MGALRETTVFIVDPAPLVVRYLTELIEAAGRARVVGSSDNARDALPQILRLGPSVVLLDLRLRAGSGIQVLLGLTNAGARAMKIVLTNFVEPSARAAAKSAGADFFYDKTLEFQHAIARIHALGMREQSEGTSHLS